MDAGAIHKLNSFGRHVNIDPLPRTAFLRNVRMEQGSQIIRLPQDKRVPISIEELIFKGGASGAYPWACLRGAVLKFGPGQIKRIRINGKGFTVPTGYTLMDHKNFLITEDERNGARSIPHQEINSMGRESLVLVHASYCHPKDLFLPQGTYTNAEFFENTSGAPAHMTFRDGVLFLDEKELPIEKKPFNILADIGSDPSAIIVALSEGGQVVLREGN